MTDNPLLYPYCWYRTKKFHTKTIIQYRRIL